MMSGCGGRAYGSMERRNRYNIYLGSGLTKNTSGVITGGGGGVSVKNKIKWN